MLKVILYAVTLFCILGHTNAVEDDDAKLDMVGLVTKYGYPIEGHSVQTGDGYILKMYRIPYGKKCGKDTPRKAPVILMHGILSNSIDYVLAGPEDGLGYILADECYDVWIPNSRGNFESRNHVSMDPSSNKFWDFSWHEMGEFDLPSLIDYVLIRSGFERLHYIGHSQGCTLFFVYASMFPEESAKKVISFNGMGPGAFMGNVKSLMMKWSAANLYMMTNWMAMMGFTEFMPSNELVSQLGGKMCSDKYPTMQAMCANSLFILCGYDIEFFNKSLLPIINAHDPAGASIHQVLHFSQSVNSGKFRRYDYGPMINLGKYGSMVPPDYEIENIKVPMYLHYSDNDLIADSKDVEKFAAKTKTSTLYKVPYNFNHLDFLWATNVKKVVYDLILEKLESSQ